MSSTETTSDDDEQHSTTNDDAAPFEAIIEARVLNDFLDPIDAIVEEFRLNLLSDGVSAEVVDPGNIAMARVHLDSDAFESFEVASEGGQLGVPLVKLRELLDFADPGDLVSLSLDQETRKLAVEFDTIDANVALIDTDSLRREPDIPELELPVKVALEGSQYRRGVMLADTVSDYVRFIGDTEAREWRMDADGDTDSRSERFSREDLIEGQVPDDHESLFSTDYLKDLTKPIPDDSEVTLRHATERPVKFDYEIGDGVSVKNMLAPRIEAR
ncbi:DNA polymerase sliding clamp [Halobaculum magnesiiphilum]|uniref:DNA polymerase sliding clamp n=1 Tax=Halobaculum magnesiiphilum TaxID=1017351 RepID=A0A8T8WB13_9EURY|nr:DNA polymerase sliding clamp [Halobaculum magnesiiphilum]QZP37052.1 DNA polymerase sliding clamp [Halobaculum magnesiiphilum]